LSRDRVCRAAVRVADEAGLPAVTMRRLADVLGVEAMSLYHHVSNKDEVLDGMVDAVAREINEAVAPLEPGPDWKASVRRRILTARQVLLRHRWAPDLLATRNPSSMAVMLYHDGLVGLLHGGGLSYDLVHHGLHVLGSRAMGFVQELTDTGSAPVSDDA